MQIHGASVHDLQSLPCITDGEKLDAGRYLRMGARLRKHTRTHTHSWHAPRCRHRARTQESTNQLSTGSLTLAHGFMVLIRVCRSPCLASRQVSCLRLAMACRCVVLFVFVCVYMCVCLCVRARACVMCVVVYACVSAALLRSGIFPLASTLHPKF